MNQSYVLSPNKKKVALQALIIGLAIIIAIPLLIFALKALIPFEIIMESVSVVAPNLDFSQMNYKPYLIGIISVVLLGFLLNYIDLNGTEYIFYPERVEIRKSFLGISAGKKEFRYSQINKIDIKRSVLMNTGTIILELNNSAKKTVTLKDINNPNQIIQYLQSLIERNRAYNYEKINQERNIDRIMDEY